MWDAIWTGAHLATMQGEGLGEIRDGAIAAAGGRIAWVGETRALPGRPEDLARAVHRCDGAWITPGLVDAHTHLVFGGDRIGEFVAALHGATRAELAAGGGGILATMRATRAADEATLGQPMRFELGASGVLSAEGSIEPGTAIRFAEEIEARGEYVKTVTLNSPGGALDDAMAMAKIVRERGIGTAVADGAICASSC